MTETVTPVPASNVEPFAWYWYDGYHCLYITGDDRKSNVPAHAMPLYAAPPAVAVKTLEWTDDEWPNAKCILGHYVINPDYRTVELVVGYGGFGEISRARIQLGKDASDAELKAAAQADYEARIRAALVSPADTSPVIPEGWHDISTAPHSEQVLVFVPRADHPKNLPLGSWHIAYQTEPSPPLAQTWRYANGQFRGEQIGWPCHWMPLPTAPLASAPKEPSHDN